MPPTPAARPHPGAALATKVPEVTVLFWVVKVLTTGMGEAASDWLGEVDLVLAGAVGVLGFTGALWLQFRTRRYVPAVYWTAVAAIAVLGTMAADAVHVGLGLPYAASTACCAVALALVLLLWRRSEGTLSVHSITTRRREVWYWLTVLCTFALGTAAGDWTADGLHLGYLGSVLLFAGLIAVPALCWWRLRLDPVVGFWSAYVLTRPLGASIADWLGKPGGEGLGDGAVTAVALLLFLALVGWVVATRHGVPRPVAPHPGRATG